MLTEAICPLVRVNVPDSIVGRFWVTAEANVGEELKTALNPNQRSGPSLYC